MKTPGFQLNLHDRMENACFESHDPSMMWDPVSKMYYSYATDSAITSPYRQGIPVRRSTDLVDFEFVGYALSEAAVAEGRDNGPDFKPTGGFWAPYVEYWNGEYRMYYSATKAFGSSESRIWLAVATAPEGPFENRGVVMDTWDTPNTDPNAIDAHVADTADGRKFFIYGSYFGGIFCKELNPENGMPMNPDTKYQGIRLAKKPAGAHVDGPEGAAVIYNPTTQYYYLFLSYGWLGDTYDIRVGRCKEITGPYVDFHGKSLDGESLGMKLAGSYCFHAKAPYATSYEEWEKSVSPEKIQNEDALRKAPCKEWQFAGFRGPGHGVPFYAPEKGEYFFVHHVRDGAEIFQNVHQGQSSFRMHYMVVRRMYFVNGWPLFSPEPFAGEDAEVECLLRDSDSDWEWLRLGYGNNDMVQSQQAPLPSDLVQENTIVFSCYDFENSKPCTALCSITEGGEIIWGKRK